MYEHADGARCSRWEGARTRRVAAWVLLGVLLGASAGRAEESLAPSAPSPIPLLHGLKTPVGFWKQVFGTYSMRQIIIHDALHLERIYSVLDFRPLADAGWSDGDIDAYARSKERDEKERVRAILVRLHQLGADTDGLTEEERRIRGLFAKSSDPSVYLEAAADDRIRGQRGLRERFAAGIEISRRYLPEMEAIFRREGLPWQLTRLPLVESCFNVRAYSKLGAAGVWQFMPSTGRLYMQVDNAVDERRDPIASTAAAARHLKANYEVLGSWPLAITAYNHGRAGMVRAVSTVGSNDLVEIIHHYHGPAFKFASRNFYAEFLAALDVEQHFEDYFGELNLHQPLRAETVVVPDYVSMKLLAQAMGIETDDLAELNPALAPDVVNGKLHVPRGYRLRVPVGSASKFSVRYASLPASAKASRQRTAYVTHRVQRGQTLASIAKKYRTTVAAIQRHNNLGKAARLRAGQSLIIPTG